MIVCQVSSIDNEISHHEGFDNNNIHQWALLFVRTAYCIQLSVLNLN